MAALANLAPHMQALSGYASMRTVQLLDIILRKINKWVENVGEFHDKYETFIFFQTLYIVLFYLCSSFFFICIQI